MNRIQACLVAFVVIVAACNKSEETAQNETAGSTDVSVAGTYTAQLPAADSPGRTITLTLEANKTASMSTDFMNGEPAIVESGSWTINPISNNVDVAVKRDGSETSEAKIMSFAMTADTLALTNWMDLDYGSAGLKLVRSPGGAP